MQERQTQIRLGQLVPSEPLGGPAGENDADDAQSRSSRRLRLCTNWNPNLPLTQRWPFVT